MTVKVPPNTDSVVTDLVRQLDYNKAEQFPKGPVNLPQYTSNAIGNQGGLPSANKHPYTLIWVTDKNTAALSNGTYWYPITLGAHY